MPEECMIKRKTIFFRTLPGTGFALLAVALFFFDGGQWPAPIHLS